MIKMEKKAGPLKKKWVAFMGLNGVKLEINTSNTINVKDEIGSKELWYVKVN